MADIVIPLDLIITSEMKAKRLIPDRVTARQFKLQLLTDGLLDQVEAWIATQDRAIQIAFEYSGTFVRDEPMMQSGFAALGFTEAQIGDFFLSASRI